jgi:hypothetical protein
VAEYELTSSLNKCGGNDPDLYDILKIICSNPGTGNPLLVFEGLYLSPHSIQNYAEISS